MVIWNSLTKINRRAISSIQNPLQFLLEDCRKCEVTYSKKHIPKKGGGIRIIYAPSQALKSLQREINRLIQYWPVNPCQFGFIKKKSCRDNVLHHLRKNGNGWNHPSPKWMVRIDLKDAFPSVKEKDVEDLFKAMFLPLRSNDFFGVGRERMMEIYDEIVHQFTRLTTYRGRLCQGAPSSPHILNLVLCHQGIIAKLRKKCEERKKQRKDCMITPFILSVYADDFVFTSLRDKIPNRFIREATTIIEESGTFTINHKKTHRNSLKYKSHRITGLTFDSQYRGHSTEGRLAISRETRKKYRQKIYRAIFILKNGNLPDKETDGFTINQILGIICHVRDVYRKRSLPPELKKIIPDFEKEFNYFKKEFGLETN